MNCPACRHGNRPGKRFCVACGTALPQVCASCGAIASAREGIAFADRWGAWFQAALARAALADALVAAGAPEQEIAQVIAEARELVRKSGGESLVPRLREAEARVAGRSDRQVLAAGLREAEARYRAMGAPDPADRLARELES